MTAELFMKKYKQAINAGFIGFSREYPFT